MSTTHDCFDALYQDAGIERLLQDRNGAGLQTANARVGFAMRGKDDRGNLASSCRQRMKKIQAAHSGHAQIEDHAGGVLEPAGLQEGFRGTKRLDGESEGEEEVPHGAAHPLVVIDHCNDLVRTAPHEFLTVKSDGGLRVG
jgi:hypothetical protein